MGGGQEHRHERPVVRSEDSRLLRLSRVEDREDVLDLRLEVGQPVERDRVGQPRASTIEVDQAPDRAEPPKEASEVGEVPDRLHVVHPRVHKQDVEGSRSDRLIREVDVSVPREPGARLLRHAQRV
jgi:hypothetical protein